MKLIYFCLGIGVLMSLGIFAFHPSRSTRKREGLAPTVRNNELNYRLFQLHVDLAREYFVTIR